MRQSILIFSPLDLKQCRVVGIFAGREYCNCIETRGEIKNKHLNIFWCVCIFVHCSMLPTNLPPQYSLDNELQRQQLEERAARVQVGEHILVLVQLFFTITIAIKNW